MSSFEWSLYLLEATLQQANPHPTSTPMARSARLPWPVLPGSGEAHGRSVSGFFEPEESGD